MPVKTFKLLSFSLDDPARWVSQFQNIAFNVVLPLYRALSHGFQTKRNRRCVVDLVWICEILNRKKANSKSVMISFSCLMHCQNWLNWIFIEAYMNHRHLENGRRWSQEIPLLIFSTSRHFTILGTLTWDPNLRYDACHLGGPKELPLKHLVKLWLELSANDTSRHPKVLKTGPNHGC